MKQNFFKSIADLRFAIVILLLIAALSIIGTVIEQIIMKEKGIIR